MANLNLQMYSFSDGTMEDTRENLAVTAKMGYSGVELFEPNFTVPAEEMKALLYDLRLEPISLHTSAGAIERMIPYAKTIGAHFIGIGMYPMFTDSDVHGFAQALNILGKKCSEAGLCLTYHNHTQEFAPCGEQTILETLLEETDPHYVSLELDAGWCAAAGYDPVEFVQRHPGRVKLIHIKESSRVLGIQPPIDWNKLPRDGSGNTILTEEMKMNFQKQKEINCSAGYGIVNWSKLQTAADANGCCHYIVEREFTPPPFRTRLEALKADLRFYQAVMK